MPADGAIRDSHARGHSPRSSAPTSLTKRRGFRGLRLLDAGHLDIAYSDERFQWKCAIKPVPTKPTRKVWFPVMWSILSSPTSSWRPLPAARMCFQIKWRRRTASYLQDRGQHYRFGPSEPPAQNSKGAPHGGAADLGARLDDRRKRRIEGLAQIKIVKADDRNVARHVASDPSQLVDGTIGHFVIGDEEGVGRIGKREERAAAFLAAFDQEVAPHLVAGWKPSARQRASPGDILRR